MNMKSLLVTALILDLVIATVYGKLTSGSVIKQGNGTFLVNGIFPITAEDGKINRQIGVMMSEAMKWAVNQVNNRPGYLHGYKLGIKEMYDSVQEDVVRKNVLDTFIHKIPFLIGPYSADTSYLSSILTTTFQQIAISYSATYSDFDLYGVDDQKMLRTVPSDKFRVSAALSLIEHLQWNYLAVVSSYGYDGERESLHFTSKLSSVGACLATQIDLAKYPTEESYKKALEVLKSDFRLSVVILFTTSKDTRKIMEALKKSGSSKRFYLVCMYGCTNYVNVIEGNEQVADGTLSLDIHIPVVEKFKEYFLAQKVTKNSPKFFKLFWEDVFKCSLNTTNKSKKYKRFCKGTERLDVGKGYYPNTPVHTVIEAVYHLAKGIHDFVEVYCDSKHVWMNDTNACLIDVNKQKEYTHWVHKFLLRSTFPDGTLKPFNWSKGKKEIHSKEASSAKVRYDIHRFTFRNRQPKNEKVWEWQVTRNTDPNQTRPSMSCKFLPLWGIYTNVSRVQERGTCSKECALGYTREYDKNSLKGKCCWTCQKCPKNNRILNNTCHACKHSEVVGPNYATCSIMNEYRISWRKPVNLVFIVLPILGFCFTVFVALIFFKYNDNRIVRASGRDLSYIILFGICLTFACPFIFLWETTQTACILRGALPGFSFLACYAPLFLKTIRIYRIFVGAQVSVSRPSLVSMQSQFIALSVILSTQLLISVVWFVSKAPKPEIIVTGEYITRHCSGDSSPILLLLNLSLSVIFMISCTVLAFKTRHFPKNFNEAKFIGITLYITCVGWAVFLPAYFLAPHIHNDFMKELLMCGVCSFIGYVTLFGLFGYKIKLLLFGPLPPQRQMSIPTWYIPRDHSKSMCSSHSCDCNGKSYSPKSCCEELNGLAMV